MKQIKDFPNYSITEDGRVFRTTGKEPKELKWIAVSYKRRYFQVGLYPNKSNRRNLKYIHRLVWETYMGEIPDDMTIDHIDSNPSNNHISNLRLATRSDNSKLWAIKNTNTLELRALRDEMLELNRSGITIREIARMYGLKYTTAWCIVRGVTINKFGLKDYKPKFDDKELNKLL